MPEAEHAGITKVIALLEMKVMCTGVPQMVIDSSLLNPLRLISSMLWLLAGKPLPVMEF